jgi:mono/diheme cytochrome c family protein
VRSKGLLNCALSLLAPLVVSCARPGGPESTRDEFGDAGVAFVSGLKCPAAVSSEPLQARAEVMGATVGSTGSSGDVIFTKDLFNNQFGSVCGECHVRNSTAQPHISLETFATYITADVVDIIRSDNVAVVMPPYGTPYSTRARDNPSDPVVKLAQTLELWIAWGQPSGSFPTTPPGTASPDADGGAPSVADAGAGTDGSVPDTGGADASPGATTAQVDYSLSPELGAALTNIGSCIPNKYGVGVNVQAMDKLDDFFAHATELPPTLAETDLVSFDSDVLARNGVVSYAPAYPLWSDAAGKMRHVRVPRNQPIVFDKKTQQFTIPPNARFYKTFFKSVIDGSGNQAWKRIETRLIVARPDETQADGTIKQNALFGTYIWNEDETKTELLNDPLHDAQPFTDRVISYITDEPKARGLVGTQVSYDQEALGADYPGLVRHYGLPSSQRCVQCHMGSPSAAFVLGFTPLQVATVAPGKSGVIEPASVDELTQLQRLIDYKVISGMASPADVLPLEQTQLPRTPRNAYELRAQAYMVGNCAHCHNPRGFPSTKAPELKDVLDFLPGPDGGIFQFPLDRTSPVRARGLNQDVLIPYITPSLRDYPADDSAGTYSRKYVECNDSSGSSTNGWCTTPGKMIDFIDAPWRSLVYRNVDTPFDYLDDLAIFPHMPMNTPGYDCRAPQIMGDWMVSIPATYVGTPGAKEDAVGNPALDGNATPDTSAQPYVEVKPGDSGYAAAQTAAQKRLDQYHGGHRYEFCPDTTDILSPAPPVSDVVVSDPTATPIRLIMPVDGVPNRPQWVVTDTTDPPGDWYPRGSDWQKPLVHQQLAHAGDSQIVIDDLKDITLDDATRQALTTEVPFGLWTAKPGCAFTGVPTVSAYQGESRPVWMDLNKGAVPTAAVYTESPGAAVFTNICINCHGPQADAKGLLADEISILTGGDARVANFRIGLFGPAGAPGQNRARVFGSLVPSATPDDAGARYLSWMALGGTTKSIPQSLLNVVATTPVLGEKRAAVGTSASANMLQLAQELCANTLVGKGPLDTIPAGSSNFFTYGPLGWTNSALVAKNGDAELWLKVCRLNNRPIVRVVVPLGPWTDSTAPINVAIDLGRSLFWGDGVGADGQPVYPASWPVLNHRGEIVEGITPDNLFPTCLRQPAGDATQPGTQANFAETFRTRYLVKGQDALPYCPPGLFAAGTGDPDPNTGAVPLAWQLPTEVGQGGALVSAAADAWAARGAINAGLAVFLYVDQLSRGLSPKPPYNHCELMGQ